MKEKVLITGGSGYVGMNLSNLLHQEGYEVIHLSRNPSNNNRFKTYFWDVENQKIDTNAINSVDHIIHLAGAGVFDKRWTQKRKQEIITSRVNAANLLFTQIKSLEIKPKSFISASGVNYYGTKTSEKILTEEDQPGNDFLAHCCVLWEKSATQFEQIGLRTVKLRTGIVIGEESQIVKQILQPIKMGFGAALGKGSQYLPWIHIEDLCQLYLKAIKETNMAGEFNAVAPTHITNSELTNKLASSVKKKIWLPNIPSWVLKLVLGERAEVILNGSRVSSKKIEQLGFTFKYKNMVFN